MSWVCSIGLTQNPGGLKAGEEEGSCWPCLFHLQGRQTYLGGHKHASSHCRLAHRLLGDATRHICCGLWFLAVLPPVHHWSVLLSLCPSIPPFFLSFCALPLPAFLPRCKHFQAPALGHRLSQLLIKWGEICLFSLLKVINLLIRAKEEWQ